tara:strand:- start:329 stop:502 length:174 start_codon:yes stop_codon:yes gene_type:complete
MEEAATGSSSIMLANLPAEIATATLFLADLSLHTTKDQEEVEEVPKDHESSFNLTGS